VKIVVIWFPNSMAEDDEYLSAEDNEDVDAAGDEADGK
jgi:hypothetical protein